jgi:hypothetical protein
MLKLSASAKVGYYGVNAARKIKIWVWGWVEYGDVFVDTPRHRTEFCAELSVNGLPGHQCFYGLRIHSKHNAADHDCMKPVMAIR